MQPFQSIQEAYVCYPKENTTKRFLLGEKGLRNLVAVGLNPSSANAYSLDPTSKNIKALAHQNQCDGWFLLNLYPQRASKPTQLPTRPDTKWLKENLNFILSFIKNEKTISKILFCWGNGIEQFQYLKECSLVIRQTTKQHHLKPYCIGKTKSNHPMHPSPLVINRFFGGTLGVSLKYFDD